MRRPLADAGLFFIFIILIVQLIYPTQINTYDTLSNRACIVQGQLVRKEVKKKNGEDTTILYIKDVILYDSDGRVMSTGSSNHLSPRSMIMCYMDSEVQSIRLGDKLSIQGTINTFSRATNPGNFDSAKYYSILRIAMSIRNARIVSTCAGEPSLYWQISNYLSHFKEKTTLLCDLTFSEDDSAILKTMLLGDKSTLSPYTKSMYSQSGIAHILAISGLHISMLGLALYRILRKCRFPVSLASLISVIILLMYGLMTGMASSCVRALIMFTLRMLAPVLHRTYDSLTSIVIAAVLILVEQPAYIFYSGFQFSFVAVSSVILIVPILKDYLPGLLSGGLSITLGTLPIHLYNYYYFPLFSVLLNLYVIPLMSVLLAIAIIAIMTCVIYIPLGQVMSVPAHLILKIYELSCELSNKLPYCKMVTGKPHIIQIVFYVVLLAIILHLHQKQSKLQLMMNLLGACLILSINIPSFANQVTMVDVGQGDCFHISNGCGLNLLIDGGSSTVTSVGKYRIEPYLLSQGIADLDGVFITHLDADHYNGILELMEDSGITGPNIKGLYLSSSTVNAGGSDYDSLITLASEREIPVYVITQGDIYSASKTNLYCLYPDRTCTGENTNDESLVLLLDYGKENILFTGDLSGTGEDSLTKLISSPDSSLTFSNGKTLKEVLAPDDTTVLKIAHHGSKNSTYDEFLTALSPGLALISAGKDNSYGHPNPSLIERLDSFHIPHYCTIDFGALTLRFYSSTRSRFRVNSVLRLTVSR